MPIILLCITGAFGIGKSLLSKLTEERIRIIAVNLTSSALVVAAATGFAARKNNGTSLERVFNFTVERFRF